MSRLNSVFAKAMPGAGGMENNYLALFGKFKEIFCAGFFFKKINAIKYNISS